MDVRAPNLNCTCITILTYQYRVSRPKNSFLGRILFLTALGLVIVNMSITALHTVASMVNYPGGEALALFNQQYSNMSCMYSSSACVVRC